MKIGKQSALCLGIVSSALWVQAAPIAHSNFGITNEVEGVLLSGSGERQDINGNKILSVDNSLIGTVSQDKEIE